MIKENSNWSNKNIATRYAVEAQLRDATRNHFKQTLISKPSQGRVYTVTSKNNASNHFYRNGNFTRLTEWNFIHRARLNVVPLKGGTQRFFSDDHSCRKCKYPNETLMHVLNCCEPSLPEMTNRHNAVMNRLVDGFYKKKKKSQDIYLDEKLRDTASTLRPDITIIDKKHKEVVMVDITCPYENYPAAFERARQEKIDKYQNIKREFEDQGYNVFLDAFIVGSLGGYDPNNYKCLAALNIPKRYSILMKKLMVSDVIKYSREIYMNHVCKKRKDQPLQ